MKAEKWLCNVKKTGITAQKSAHVRSKNEGECAALE